MALKVSSSITFCNSISGRKRKVGRKMRKWEAGQDEAKKRKE